MTTNNFFSNSIYFDHARKSIVCHVSVDTSNEAKVSGKYIHKKLYELFDHYMTLTHAKHMLFEFIKRSSTHNEEMRMPEPDALAHICDVVKNKLDSKTIRPESNRGDSNEITLDVFCERKPVYRGIHRFKFSFRFMKDDRCVCSIDVKYSKTRGKKLTCLPPKLIY